MDRLSALKLAQAYDFAARKHTDQRRKGVRAEPYINHLTEVAVLGGGGH
jgi:guanosine-3',5'-bis(diphosphate) 3'-pyrophosphohydrolase